MSEDNIVQTIIKNSISTKKFLEPSVSILIPVYNAEKYLEQCLDSCINQTYKNIEIVCVNDGFNPGLPFRMLSGSLSSVMLNISVI